MLKKIVSSISTVILVCAVVKAHSSPDAKHLRLLAQLYPFYEQQALKSLPPFGTYVTALDTSLIERYTVQVKQALTQERLAETDKQAIKKIAYLMTRGPVYRNASADSRWRNYAKQSIVLALQTNAVGIEILDALKAHNPQLQAEIEAYSINI